MSIYNAGERSSSPATPETGRQLLYPKSSGWFSKDSLGNEKQISNLLGEIKIYPASTPPSGWMICDGTAISRTTYAALFALIGTSYGDGNSSTTFNLPDLRNKFPIGVGAGHALASTGGNSSVTLTTGNMPSHTHTATSDLYATSDGPGAPGPSTNSSLCNTGTGGPSANIYLTEAGDADNLISLNPKMISTTLSSVGGGSPVDILPPFLALNFIIAVL